MLFTQKIFNLNNFKKKIKTKPFQEAKSKFYSNIKSKSYGFINDLHEKKIEKITKSLLANTVIEEYSIEIS